MPSSTIRLSSQAIIRSRRAMVASHAIAGLMILISGLSVQMLGL